MKKITHPFQIPKIIRTAIIFVFIFCLSPSFSQVNLHDCNFHCTSNNFTLNDVFLSATNTPGSIPLSNTTCTPGTTSTAYIMLNYTSNSSSDIHFVRLNSDLIINGVHNFVNVDLGTVIGGAGQVQLYGPFTYVCGHELVLQNTIIAWKTNENNDPGDNYTCDDYSSAQCDFSPNTIISKPFAVQFTYKACTVGTVTTVSFTSSTLGGVAPYVFDWDFDGDGITDSTDANPIHVYNGTGNSATLKATDAQLLFNSQTQTIVNPDELVLSAVATNVGCGSGSTGSIDLTVVGGTPPYTYAWSNSATTQDVSGLIAGDYNVVVTDSNNCQKTLDKTIANGDSDNPIVTAPADVTYEGCTTSALVANNLPAFSLTETTISLAVFNQIGGSYTDASAISSIMYQDVQSGSCPISVIRTFRVKDICDNVGSANQTIFIDDTTLPTASNPEPIILPGINGSFPAPDISVVINEADNCSMPVVAFVSDGTPMLNGCVETTVRTYSVTDACLNTINVTQNLVRSFDTTPPIAPMLTDVTGQCFATATVPTTTDNCFGTITGTTTDSTTYFTQGIFTIHWLFDDGHGNTTQVNQNVIIDDTTPPDAPMLSDVLGQCSATATVPFTTDNCSQTPIAGTTPDSLTYTTQGTHIIHWSFNDGHGNTTNVNQNVIVLDTTPPVTPMLPNVTGQCSATAITPSTTDNCSGIITATTTNPLSYNTQGTHIIHWSFNDGHGNTTQVNQNVIVQDTTPPVTPMLANVTGQCSATATIPTTSDNCSGIITGTTTDPLTYTTQGTHIIHWTFNDGNGNSIQVNQNVIVDDTVNPITPTLADVTGQCSATATVPSTTDNCSQTPIVGTTLDPLTYTTQGTHIIHWTFNDGHGNSIQVNQNVIVDDTVNPVTPTLADVTGQCSATATVPSTTDNCSQTPIVGTTPDPLTYTTQGTHVIHWTFNDGNGNSIQVNQNVIVDDTVNPVTPMLADVTGQCSATATVPSTTDNCSEMPIIGTTTDPLTYTTQGTHIIHWTFNDGNGNSIQVNQNVIVDDTVNPLTPTLADVMGQCSATATVPSTTDNCSQTPIVGTTPDPLTYTTQGTHIIHWTFNDGNGNSIQVNQNVIVDDTVNPVTPTLADVMGQCSATATVPSTTDNCSEMPIIGTTNDALTYTTQGTHIIHWTFNDVNGNSIQVNQNVIVDDTVNPLTPTLADVTGQCSATATVPSTTDNCSEMPIIGTTPDPLTYTTQGTHIIHWTFNDGNGNSIQVNQNVIVDDTVNPVTPTLADVMGQCSATATVPSTTDNCSEMPIIGTTNDPLTYTTQGTHIIHWTFNDGNGNSIQVNQNVIVDDTVNPVTPTLADVTGQCSATATVPSTTDNCSEMPIIGTTNDSLTYTTQGTHVIHWTFNDGNGNSIQVNQNVIVHDTTPPVIPGLADVTGQCSATATVPSTTDNCSELPIIGTTIDPLTYTTQGTFIIHWHFNDGHGNSIVVSQNVIVHDTVNPVAPILADITGQCSATAPIPFTTDNCSQTPIAGTTTDPITYNIQGSFVIHWLFNDGNGNIILVDQNVIIQDTTPPIAPMLSDVTGQCSATAPVPSTYDNCSEVSLMPILGTTTDPLTYTTQGTHVIHWTFDDGHGNTTHVNQNVIVHDTIPPVVPILSDVTGQCSATAMVPSTTDNCSELPIIGTTTDALTYTTQGTHVIHWTFDDGHGNSIVVNQNVIVHDTTPPVTPVLADVTGQCSATASVPSTSDNCSDVAIIGTTTDPLSYYTQGTHTIHWVFNDGNGNSIHVNQDVIVHDTTLPVTPMLSDIIGQCSATASVPFTTDNCSETPIIGTTTDAITYTSQGTHIIHWTFDDGHGNSIVVNQNVIIQDTTPPVTPMLVNVTGLCSVTLDVPTTTDNCAGIITGATNDPLTYSNHGSHVVHWTFDDGNGNIFTVNQNVTVTQDDIIVHNAFSPNNDGLNEFFNIENIENTVCFPTNKVEIYNRWGVLVYETDQYDNNSRVFKGISEGRVTIDRAMELPTGTYYYILNYTTSEGEYLNKKGYVYLSK